MDKKTNKRMSRSEFLSKIATENDLDYNLVLKIYNLIVDNIEESMMRGERLTLTGFGSFYCVKHKGHPIQFDLNSGESTTGEVEDYLVMKFSPSNVLSKRLRKAFSEGEIELD